MELDHLFIRARYGAPEAELLRAFGLTEGADNHHPGQGTANRRFFFDNAFIELLWIVDEAEARSEQTRRTMLFERLSGTRSDASPFGVCFRPPAGQALPSFASWDYTPPYLPPGMAIQIADHAPLSEPMWFFLSSATPPASWDATRRQPLEHAAGLREISSVRITLPHGGGSGPGGIALADGEHLLEIIFDHAAQGRMYDFRPHLPLIFRY